MTGLADAFGQPPLSAAAEREGSRTHPAVHVGKWILGDLFSTLLFVGLYALTGSVTAATGLAILAGLLQIALLRLRRAPIDAMQWISLCLVLVFGAASLLTHDPRFVMLKPSLIYAAIGGAMLKRNWMVRYTPPIALTWTGDLVVVFSHVWAGLMFLTSALNLALAAYGDPKLWAVFIGVFPIASKFALFAAQYGIMRRTVIARRNAAAFAP